MGVLLQELIYVRPSDVLRDNVSITLFRQIAGIPYRIEVPTLI